MGDEHGISWPDGGMVASDSCSSTRKTRSDKGRRRGIDSATQATEPSQVPTPDGFGTQSCVIEAMLANLIRQHEKTIAELEAEVERLRKAAEWAVKYMHHFLTLGGQQEVDPNDPDLIDSEPYESYMKLKAALEASDGTDHA